MKDKRVVFMGTPKYSIPVFDMLIKNTNLIAVVTQPDKFVGRKKTLTLCPVKEMAIKNNILVFSPVNLKEEYQKIIDLKPDIIITCAYGQILPEELIYAPKYNTVNVHASLLPKYRGGAPIHHAILNGEKETGITIMFTDKGMDTGDIIEKEIVPIGENDTYDVISEKLSFLGASLLKEVLPTIFNKTYKREKQDIDKKTIARIIKREDEHIDFSKTAKDVHNKIRGLSSVPGAYSLFENMQVKIYESSLDNCCNTNEKPGTITRIDKNSLYVACLDKEIRLLKIQIPGKKPMMIKDYLNGIDKKKLEFKKFY